VHVPNNYTNIQSNIWRVTYIVFCDMPTSNVAAAHAPSSCSQFFTTLKAFAAHFRLDAPSINGVIPSQVARSLSVSAALYLVIALLFLTVRYGFACRVWACRAGCGAWQCRAQYVSGMRSQIDISPFRGGLNIVCLKLQMKCYLLAAQPKLSA
jgi:hypothetical protein